MADIIITPESGTIIFYDEQNGSEIGRMHGNSENGLNITPGNGRKVNIQNFKPVSFDSTEFDTVTNVHSNNFILIEQNGQIVKSTIANAALQGSVGLQGATGPQGLQGNVGATGPQGLQGVQGNTGPQGLRGYTGPQGLQGNVGATGPQGLQGNVGATGPQGLRGDTGPQGLQGVQGNTGPQGLRGYTGPQGLQGNVGATGPQGVKGDQGNTGPQGNIGPTGPQGLQGNVGATGPQGLRGNTGPIGPTGPQGLRGNTGPIGPTGPQGVKGDQGNTGPQGNIGNTGPQGLQGNTGPQGNIGATGPTEYNTANANYVLSGGGTVTYTGSYIKWSQRVIAIPVEKTEFGSAGYIDITSPTSGTITYYNAANATTTVSCNSNGIPIGVWEALWYQVTPGQTSASSQTRFRLVNYQNSVWDPGVGWVLICVRNGDDSTNNGHLKWLPGQVNFPQGGGTYYSATGLTSWAIGPQGAQGNTGPQGVKGDQGNTGPQGNIGPTGPTGSQGLRGYTGPQGAQGNTGPQGLTGATGPGGLATSDPTLVPNSTALTNVVVISQANYDALGSYSSTTLYVITD